MTQSKYAVMRKCLALLLAIVLIIPFYAFSAAAAEPRASYYLDAYTAYVCAMGSGDLEIWYEVYATKDWTDVGVLTIQLFVSEDNTESSNWTWVETFRHTDFEQMLVHGTWYNISHVDYEGTPGMYYKAYVTIYAGDESTGDSRYIWTEVERCT